MTAAEKLKTWNKRRAATEKKGIEEFNRLRYLFNTQKNERRNKNL